MDFHTRYLYLETRLAHTWIVSIYVAGSLPMIDKQTVSQAVQALEEQIAQAETPSELRELVVEINMLLDKIERAARPQLRKPS